MISQAQIDSLPELRRAMSSTTDLTRLRRLRARYLIRVVETRSQLGLDAVLKQPDSETEVVRWFQAELYRIARDELEFGWDSMWAVLSPAQRFQVVSLSFDPDGMVKPPAGPMPSDISNSQMSLTDILLRISPLLVLRGDAAMTIQTDPVFFPLPSWPGYLVESGRRGVTWRRSVAITLGIRSRVDRLDFLLLGILRHEAMRIFNDVDDTFFPSVPSYVGYTLRTQNLPTTDPEHADKDGFKFFRDDREGSSLPWAERIIPPYRRNCACFMVPILEEPGDAAFIAQFRLPIALASGTGRGQPILIRDPVHFMDWFDRQPAAIQKKLMGEKRWFAASAKGVGIVKFADFVMPGGKVMSPRRLLDESPRQRMQRRAEAEVTMRMQSVALREGWSNRTDLAELLNPAVEQDYRDKLAKRLAAILQKS